MYFNIITVILPVLTLGHATFASPLKSATSVNLKAVEVSDFSALKAASVRTPSITEFKGELPQIAGFSSTTANTGFRAFESDQGSGPIFCDEQGCQGNCYFYSLNSFLWNQCYEVSPPFLSVIAYSDDGEGYPFALNVGLRGCVDPQFVPDINTCYDTYYNDESYYFSSFYAET
jgi:hypothetical protein